jgi:hypothetical protein
MPCAPPLMSPPPPTSDVGADQIRNPGSSPRLHHLGDLIGQYQALGRKLHLPGNVRCLEAGGKTARGSWKLPAQVVVIEMFEKAEKFLMAMTGLALRNHSTRDDVERGEQCHRTVAEVIMRHPFGIAPTIGNTGCVRSSAGIWLYSSMHSTSALSGGLR